MCLFMISTIWAMRQTFAVSPPVTGYFMIATGGTYPRLIRRNISRLASLVLPWSLALNKSAASREVVETAQRATSSSNPLYVHGVAARPPRRRRPKLHFRFVGRTDSGDLFTGYAYTDGSLRRRGGKDDLRGGWSCVIVDARGRLLYGMYGPRIRSLPLSTPNCWL